MNAASKRIWHHCAVRIWEFLTHPLQSRFEEEQEELGSVFDLKKTRHHPTLKDDVTFCALRIAFFLSNFHNGAKVSLNLHLINYVFIISNQNTYTASQFKLSWLGTHKLRNQYVLMQCLNISIIISIMASVWKSLIINRCDFIKILIPLWSSTFGLGMKS